MQFKNPEILYALFLLLIPIFIHLFQLRRFQKVAFTNVAFLKKVTIQTRKSSQLKKWLSLLLRLLALACIIFAFAQPFLPSKNLIDRPQENIIYIDNSFSMQASGPKGALLERSLQDLYDKVNGSSRFGWFTNDSERKNTSPQDFKNEVLNIEYSSNQLSPSQVLLKANQLFSQDDTNQKRLIYISDFQFKEDFSDIPEDLILDAVQLQPIKTSNIALDSVFITSKNASKIQLKVIVSKMGKDISQVPISLFNKDKLIAKTALDFSEKMQNSVIFDIDNTSDFVGKVEINDPNILYDNQLYLNINKPKKINVLAINQADGQFLKRIFEKDEFQFLPQSFESSDYNIFPDQNLIIINGLQEIQSSMMTALNSFHENGGSIAIIPNKQVNLESYNKFLNTLNLGILKENSKVEKKITQINFQHPLFNEVFEKEVANFQYPKVNSFYDISTNATSVLKYEDSRAFLIEKNQLYLFTSALDEENSNFKSSPLIVPTLYNMALNSLPLPKLYYTIGQENNFAIPVKLGSDEILKINDSISSWIPRQQTKANHVLLSTIDEPDKAGNYQIIKEQEFLENISYNFLRSESDLNYLKIENWKGANVHKNISSLFESITEANSIKGLWKWFVIFALLFLIMEMFVLKYLK